MNANGPVERDGGMLLSHVLIGPEYRQEFGKVNSGDAEWTVYKIEQAD